MRISPVSTPMNNCAAQKTSKQLAFRGLLMTRGNWPEKLSNEFFKSEAMNELANGDKVIIGILKKRNATLMDYGCKEGEPMYKLQLEVRKENPTFVDRVKEFFKKNNI